MAEHDAQDRQLPASERRIRKAREQGQVARSRDLSHFAAVAAGLALVSVGVPLLAAHLRRTLAASLAFDARILAGPDAMLERLAALGGAWLVFVLGLGAVMGGTAVAAALAAGGWNWTLQPLAPRLDKLDPLAGLARLVSRDQLAETLKACILALVLAGLGAAFLLTHFEAFAAALAAPLPAALEHAGGTMLAGLGWIALALAAFALVDLPLQRWRLAQRLKMSHQELKEEHKELEGNQEVKAKIRVRMREMTRRRMLAAVPGADLVVMNPTHYAVALKYDDRSMAAPRVVAKGADLLALRIRDVARDAKVPVLTAPPLARALYAHAEIDREIPAALFAAVAQVLAWVYQLRAAAQGRGATPPEPEVAVPPGLDPQAAAAR